MQSVRESLWKCLVKYFVSAAMLLALWVPLASRAYLEEPAPKPAPVVPPFKGDYKVTNWEMLIPKDWDPYAPFRAESNKMAALSDASPQADELIRKMREVWDNAPTDHALNGARTRLPGYVVPLEETKEGLKEFLLVPYFGACIHTPPPPANQIVHVVSDKPLKGVRSMDPVWVVGTLTTTRRNTDMGVSGYRLQATGLAPYKTQAR